MRLISEETNSKELTFSIFVFAILCSDVLFYLGLSVLTKALFLISFLVLLKKSKAKDVYTVVLFLSLLYMTFFVGFILGHQKLDYFIFPLLIVMGFLISQGNFEPNRYRMFFMCFLLINGFALVYEKLNGSYLMDTGHPYSIIQGQGLFTWTKVQGEFLIAMSLLVSKDRFVLLIIFFSALLSGVRAAALLSGFLLMLTVFNIHKDKYKLINKYSVLFFVTSMFLLIPVFQQTFDDYSIERYTSMLDLNSSTYSVRGYVHDLHYGCIGEYSVSQLLFGRGEYCAKLFDWGAESTIIHSIEYYGLIVSLCLVSILMYALIKNIQWLNYQTVAILLVLMTYFWNWRFGFTYTGIFLWWYIFRVAKRAD